MIFLQIFPPVLFMYFLIMRKINLKKEVYNFKERVRLEKSSVTAGREVGLLAIHCSTTLWNEFLPEKSL